MIRFRSAALLSSAALLFAACGGAGSKIDASRGNDETTDTRASETTGDGAPETTDDTSRTVETDAPPTDRSLQARLRKAPDALVEAGSAHMAIEIDMSDLDIVGLGNAAMTIEGDVDTANGDAALNMDMGALLGGMLPRGVELEPIEVRMVDGVMYLNFGAFLQQVADATGEELPAGLDIEWVKVDLGALGGGTAGSNPDVWAQNITLLAVAEDIDEVGTEKLDGVETTHLAMTVTEEQIEKLLDDQFEEQFEENFGDLPDYLVEAMKMGLSAYSGDLDIDVWLDDDGIVRQMKMDAPMEIPGSGGGVMHMTMSVSEIGVEIDVVAPEGALDFEEFMELAQGG